MRCIPARIEMLQRDLYEVPRDKMTQHDAARRQVVAARIPRKPITREPYNFAFISFLNREDRPYAMHAWCCAHSRAFARIRAHSRASRALARVRAPSRAFACIRTHSREMLGEVGRAGNATSICAPEGRCAGREAAAGRPLRGVAELGGRFPRAPEEWPPPLHPRLPFGTLFLNVTLLLDPASVPGISPYRLTPSLIWTRFPAPFPLCPTS